MPELPEVEVVRRGLVPVMTGRQFVRVEQRRRDLRFPFPKGFCERLEGATVKAVERRAKYLLVRLSTGDVLLMHLGMTGRFSVVDGAKAKAAGGVTLGDYVYDAGADPAHDHAVFHMSGGGIVIYNDPRRFGFMLLVPEPEIASHAMIGKLGVEPLGGGLGAGYLADAARGRRTDLKAFLLDQRIIAGLGNIYVCEALHRAGLSPKRRAATLAARSAAARERSQRLVSEIQAVLHESIDAGGSTLSDYRHADGAPGVFQESHLVYDREGEPCRRPGCTGTIRRIVQSGRSTFYCPCCQT